MKVIFLKKGIVTQGTKGEIIQDWEKKKNKRYFEEIEGRTWIRLSSGTILSCRDEWFETIK